MLEMILVSVRLCNNDATFHRLLCEQLYRHQRELLLLVNEPFVEAFLLQTDEELLYRWQGRNGFHERATEIMYRRAVAVNEPDAPAPVTIFQRVEHLRYALRSANATDSGNKSNYLSSCGWGSVGYRV